MERILMEWILPNCPATWMTFVASLNPFGIHNLLLDVGDAGVNRRFRSANE